MTDAVLGKLRRIEGQARGISQMYQEGRSCLEIVQQIAATRSALSGVAKDLLTDESVRCANSKSGKEKLEKTLKRLFEIA